MSDSSWEHRAACKKEDPELFFPVGTGKPARDQAAKAKRVCARCPVSDPCRARADATESVGVWGGKTDDERRAERAARAANNRRGAA